MELAQAAPPTAALPPDEIAELTQLETVSEESVCEVLKARLLCGNIYTGMSAMLLAVNPCENLSGLYSAEVVARYLDSEENPPPHVFRTAAALHRGMMQGRSQSVVISGERSAAPSNASAGFARACTHLRAMPPPRAVSNAHARRVHAPATYAVVLARRRLSSV